MVYRNYLTIVILLIITIFVCWGFYFYVFPERDTIDIKNFPSRIGHWTAQDLPINNVELAELKTKNVFLRRYTDGSGRSVYLYVAYSQSDPKATDPPEVFYEDSNISILDKGKVSIIINSSNFSIHANWLLLDDNQSQQIAYYWFKVGRFYIRSYWMQQILAAYNNISGRNTGSALIRVSADIVNGHHKDAIKIIDEFVSLIGPQLSYLP